MVSNCYCVSVSVPRVCTSVLFIFFRGETFRKEFANLGEVRSIIPPEVKVMALTATATVQTRKAVCKTLGIVNVAVIAESPNKENIKYVVHHNPETLEETFARLVEELLRCHGSSDCVLSHVRLLCQYLFVHQKPAWKRLY